MKKIILYIVIWVSYLLILTTSIHYLGETDIIETWFEYLCIILSVASIVLGAVAVSVFTEKVRKLKK